MVTYTEVAIIGSGFSGLGLAVQLKREGKRDFLVLERAQEVGGAWRDNTYPGAACDIQSHLYSYSFRPNPNWSRVYAPQAEILEYLQKTAEEENIYPHIKFGANVSSAVWDEKSQLWVISSEAGEVRARSLVSASGHLSDAAFPDIPGIEKFAGQLFHSAQWDHSSDLTNRRVGVIGTGASAIQIVPTIAPTVAKLTVFQRTAPYIIPRRDYVYSEVEQRMFERLPSTAQALRDELFWGNESRFPQRRQVPEFIDRIERTALGHLKNQVSDPALRAKLTPDYTIGCKRILISNDYYPALTRENVSLVTEGISYIDEQGVVLTSGEHIELDALVVATGFEATDLPIADVIHGQGGVKLSDSWEAGGQAFACTTVSGFPNLFMMLGPNTGLGAGSMIYMVETQAAYIQEALAHIDENQVVINPDSVAQDSYVESIYRRAEGSVWLAGGCKSWYLHPKSGKLTALWPDFMSQFRRENGAFSTSGYQQSPRVETTSSDLSRV